MRFMLTGFNPETLGYIFSGDFLDFAANINNSERILAVWWQMCPAGLGQEAAQSGLLMDKAGPPDGLHSPLSLSARPLTGLTPSSLGVRNCAKCPQGKKSPPHTAALMAESA